MYSIQVLIIYISIHYFCIAYGWQQQELSDFGDDPLPLAPSSSWKETAEKRNTWWTKKSIQDEEYSNNCSLEKCMGVFIECLRQAESKKIFLHCKEAHLSCLASCFKKYKERFLFNSVAMAS